MNYTWHSIWKKFKKKASNFEIGRFIYCCCWIIEV